MEKRKKKIFLVIAVLTLTIASCSPASPEPQAAPTMIVEQNPAPSQNGSPRTEAEVPRVSLEETLAALQSGAAVIVDVRSAQAYAASHIAGAISIPLSQIETNPTGLDLDKDQWIITYCTWLNEHTSARAAFVLLNNGYTNVTPILGGYAAWLDAGYPIEP